jgi:hypothetical protein
MRRVVVDAVVASVSVALSRPLLYSRRRQFIRSVMCRAVAASRVVVAASPAVVAVSWYLFKRICW